MDSLGVIMLIAPVILFFTYGIASLVDVIASARAAAQNEEHGKADEKLGKEPKKDSTTSNRWVALVFILAVTFTYLAEAITIISTDPVKVLVSTDDTIVSCLYHTLIWTVLYIGFSDLQDTSHLFPFYSSWAVELLFDLLIFVLSVGRDQLPHNAHVAQISIQVIRVCSVLVLILLQPLETFCKPRAKQADEERAHLLVADNDTTRSTTYGSVANGHAQSSNTEARQDSQGASDGVAADEEEEEEDDDDERGYRKLKKHWWVYVRSFAIFLPYLWPSESVRLHIHFVGLALCLGATRVLNVVVPLQVGLIVNALADESKGVPWRQILLFMFLRLLASSGGIELAQSFLWLPIEQVSLQKLSCASYDHVMGLSCDFHTTKKSGNMWQTIHRGQSIVSLAHAIAFDMAPMIVDLIIAIGVFYFLFDAYMAFIGATIVVLVLYSTRKTLSTKADWQRKFIKRWETAFEQMTESSLNWTTVSWFNRVKYESSRFQKAVSEEKDTWVKYRMISYGLNAMRSVLLLVGLLAALLVAATQIKLGGKPVGDFVALLTYWAQLGGPLAYVASGFTRIIENLIDSEKLLVLLKKEASVRDRPGATRFELKEGKVVFDKVRFSYDNQREVLKGVSFGAAPGQTIALVGESGGGKSTILKLLFRFYDVCQGSIKIDGQELRDVSQESFRQHLGVVPQDVALFNQTIMENLRYAKLQATEEECQDACKAVSLHDKIMKFPKQYNTIVGERGIKMSGGELQRMAIARVLLKDAKIILLDEATSSVDSETEAVIQESLKKLTSEKTTFVIAHRLSTIVNADLVLVIREGTIAEQGTHSQLLEAKGYYHSLWAQQTKLHGDQATTLAPPKVDEGPPIFMKDVEETLGDKSKGDVGEIDRVSNSVGNLSSDPAPTNSDSGKRSNTSANERASLTEKLDSDAGEAHQASHVAAAERSKSPEPKQSRSTSKPAKFRMSASGARAKFRPEAPEFVPRNMKSDDKAAASKRSTVENRYSSESTVSEPFELFISNSGAVSGNRADINKNDPKSKTSSSQARNSFGRGYKKWAKNRSSRSSTNTEQQTSSTKPDQNHENNLYRRDTMDSPALRDAQESTLEWAEETADSVEPPKKQSSKFRRKDSKSEPHSNKPGGTYMDGAEDFPELEEENLQLSQGNAILAQHGHRRVTTPARYPQSGHRKQRGSNKHANGIDSGSINSENAGSGIVAPTTTPNGHGRVLRGTMSADDG